MKGTINHSIASKKRMLAIPKEELSARMSALAKRRMQKMSLEDRKEVGKMLAKSRASVKI